MIVLIRHYAHARMGLLRTRRAIIGALAALLLVFGASATFAVPKPPTNGGNGAGQSGQCTGPAADRPASCQSP